MDQSVNPASRINNADPMETRKTSPLLLVLAWTVVLLPTAWGVSYTIQNAMKIFTAAPANPAPAPATTAPTSNSPAAKP